MVFVHRENGTLPDDPIAARLEAVLATLPEEWLLLPGRPIPGGPRVGSVLIHPEIGIALVDLAPASLRTPAPLRAMSDPGWPYRMIDLPLHAADAAMLRPPRRAPAEPQAEPEPDAEPLTPSLRPPEADERIPVATPRRNAAMAAIAAAALLLGGAGAIAYLALHAAANDGGMTVATLPVPDMPAPRDAAPVKPPNSPPPATSATPAATAAAAPPVSPRPTEALAAPERAPAERQHRLALLHGPVSKPRPEVHRIVAAEPHEPSSRKVAAVEPPQSAAPPDEDNRPPIDPADRPPLEGSDVPPGSPLRLVGDAPFSGPPADGKPVMLLPQVAPATMPPPPAPYGPAAGTLIGPAPQ
jgi:hypothetical protein